MVSDFPGDVRYRPENLIEHREAERCSRRLQYSYALAGKSLVAERSQAAHIHLRGTLILEGDLGNEEARDRHCKGVGVRAP